MDDLPNPEPLHPNQAHPEDDLQVAMLQPTLGSFDEKMKQALFLLKDKFPGGTLVQVWTPEWRRGKYVLSACNRPYLVDEELIEYREASEYFTFATDNSPGSFPDLPGRVFISKTPEWSSDVTYCFQTDFARVSHALHFNVRGSLALPVFDPHDGSCSAVIELATTAAKTNFDQEISCISHAIEAVGFKTVHVPAHPSPQVADQDGFKDHQTPSNSSVMGMIGGQFGGRSDQPSSSNVTISSHENRSMVNDSASSIK